MYDGINWTSYDSYFLPTVIEIDAHGGVWVGTNGGGVSKFDGSEWITYSSSNSDAVSILAAS